MVQLLPENNLNKEIENKEIIWDRKSGWATLFLFIVIYFGLNLLSGLFQNDTIDPFILTLIALVINIIACFGSVWLMAVLIKKHAFKELGFGKTDWLWIRRAVYWGIGFMFLRGLLGQGLMNLFPFLSFGTDILEQALVTNNSTLMSHVIVIFLGALVIPIGEELFFRGFLYRWMRNRMTFRMAILSSALVFSAFHLIPIQAILAFPLGVVNAWMFERSKSLLPAIVLHMTNNGLALILAAVATNLQ